MDIKGQILRKIKLSQNILINIHKSPDYDSFSSALSLRYFLRKLGKKATVISCQKINRHFHFLEGAKNIKVINYSKFDFSPYDLFIIPDTATMERVTGSVEIKLPKGIDYIAIDHHQTNEIGYPLRLVESRSSATAEVLFDLFDKWRVKIDPRLATLLLAGILGDTVFLRFCEDRKKTMETVLQLVRKGADMDFLSEKFFEDYAFNLVRAVGYFLINLKREKNFVWSAMDFETYKKFGQPEGVREMAADNFFRGVRGVGYGVAILETKKGVVNMSFRSKKKVDVTKYAKLFGGGGHKNAAGATILASYDEAIKKIRTTLSG